MNAEINQKIIYYLKTYDPLKISVFGSYARGEETDNSDIDILVNFNRNLSLFDLGGIKYDLTELLDRPIDIVTERSINKRVKPFIEKDLKTIYG
ncbi:MAG: nucleotidyltransferase family protein [Bacteroidia bacterium]|nr:nucleotidyltransferase family protein [Bacteroidia bacterium]